MTVHGARQQLVNVLRDPITAQNLDEARWSSLIATARSANLLGALAQSLQNAAVLVDRTAQRHLNGASQLSVRQHQSVVWELHQLQAALGQLSIPVVLLKGAAYGTAGHSVAKGRLFGDIDILVPRTAIGDVESRLMLNGWVTAKTSAYDQHYYRTWMHELPPMVHVRRGTVLDVHHTILPLTTRNRPDPEQIFARALPVGIAGLPALHVPCPEDLVIHSMTHLVHEGELHNGLRDLRDIDCMLRDFGDLPGFWERFVRNATGNDLAGPVHLGLLLVGHFFHTPIPASVADELSAANGLSWAPRWLLKTYDTALLADQGTGVRMASNLALLVIYIRSHSLRMPWPMLVRHLTIKAWTAGRAPFAHEGR